MPKKSSKSGAAPKNGTAETNGIAALTRELWQAAVD
jgi:hypothetical protein